VPLCINIKELVNREFIKELFMLYDYEGDGTMSTDYLRKMLIPEAGSVSKAR